MTTPEEDVPTPDETEPGLTGGLLDLSNLTFTEIMEAESPNLTACIKRLLEDLDRTEGALSAFQSFASAD